MRLARFRKRNARLRGAIVANLGLARELLSAVTALCAEAANDLHLAMLLLDVVRQQSEGHLSAP